MQRGGVLQGAGRQQPQPQHGGEHGEHGAGQPHTLHNCCAICVAPITSFAAIGGGGMKYDRKLGGIVTCCGVLKYDG